MTCKPEKKAAKALVNVERKKTEDCPKIEPIGGGIPINP
jgi:hypothetical protein